MYRVRLESGEEAAYRTRQELATALRSGILNQGAQVFHMDANDWVPILEHPDCAGIQGGQPSSAARVTQSRSLGAVRPEPWPKQATPPSAAERSSRPSNPAAGLADFPECREPGQSAAPLPTPFRPTSERPSKGRAGMVPRLLGIALPVLLAAAIAGGTISWPGSGAAEGTPVAGAVSRTARAERSRVADLTRSLREAIAPSPPLPLDAPSNPDSLLPPGDAFLSRLGASPPPGLTYAEAYADAQTALEEAFELVGFRDLFAPVRFAHTDSIRSARRMVAAAANIIVVYRGQEVMLEQTYHNGGSGSPETLRESFEQAEAGRALLAAADSLFGLLLTHAGRFALAEQQISFADSATARRYGALRREIVSLVRGTQPVPRGGETVGALGRLRRTIGNDYPPSVPPP